MNKIKLPLSCLSLLISSQVLAVEHDLDNAGEVNKFVTTDVFPQKALGAVDLCSTYINQPTLVATS
ncbi:MULTISPECIES: hypothetical protein [unclassified Pseudoalteromonas]|uniref:hypothetical protein n=1 Tax=unclassified Pseudoalteromonas TaxID=194690 RepID=UPI0004202790|nr:MULTISPECIES: hypothetical protein [unclassified Pseudoalteromonas]